MGPIILLDKSALQGLNPTEIRFLAKHFTVVIPPILIVEIAADLAKSVHPVGALSREQVSILANKLTPADSAVNVDYRMGCESSLAGFQHPLDGRPWIPVQVIRPKNCPPGYLVDDGAIWAEIRRWQDGDFTGNDELVAQTWQAYKRGLDFESFVKNAPEIWKRADVKGIPHLIQIVNSDLSNADKEVQRRHLDIVLRLISASLPVRNQTFDRWLALGLPQLEDFAPYAGFCLKIFKLFSMGITAKVLPSRGDNFVDLEYFYYAPFCMVFCSEDKFHRTLAPAVLRADQVFITGKQLKDDLRWIANEWDSLTPEERNERAREYGSYPPHNPDSVTFRAWVRFMLPWQPGSGNRALGMSKEAQAKLVEDLRPIFDAIDEHNRQKK